MRKDDSDDPVAGSIRAGQRQLLQFQVVALLQESPGLVELGRLGGLEVQGGEAVDSLTASAGVAGLGLAPDKKKR
jgi:hypothetical protein